MAVSQRVAGSVLLVVAQAAGVFRRTPIQRLDQQLSWLRTNQAFFATGACHILAWVCRDAYPDREIMAAAMRLNGDPQVSHVYATWGSWAFDHSGWNVESELVEVNAAFEARPVERLTINTELGDFCREHHHRLPHQYWQDPIERAYNYVTAHQPP